MDRIYFIGAVNKHGRTQGGETIKNQIFLTFLKRHFDVKTIDTFQWNKNNILVYFKLVRFLFSHKKKVILSTSARGTYYFLKLLSLFRISKKNIYYFIIGGIVADRIINGDYLIKYYKGVQYFFAETNDLQQKLIKLGFNNSTVIPNFKDYRYKPHLINSDEKKNVFKCYFLSRITEDKGCELIFDAINTLNNKGYYIQVDFYGQIELNYKDKFLSNITNNGQFQYKGFINLSDEDNYTKLSNYDLFLFPTFYHGEGFPGAIIDAFIAGVPTIASDWNYNSEIINNGDNGFIIESRNAKALADKIEFCITNRNILSNMKKRSVLSAEKYHIENVLKKIHEYLNY